MAEGLNRPHLGYPIGVYVKIEDGCCPQYLGDTIRKTAGIRRAKPIWVCEYL